MNRLYVVLWSRTDAHRPSAIVPEDYEFVSFDYVGPSLGFDQAAFLLSQRQLFREHVTRTGGTYAKHENSGSCHICGACAFYLVRWYHAKSNQYISTGEDCAQKVGMSYGNMNAFRRSVADAREAQAGKRKAIATLADANLMKAWEIYSATVEHLDGCAAAGRNDFGDDNGVTNPCTCEFSARWDANNRYEEITVRDIVGKLVKYGSISDAQKGFIIKLLDRILQRPIIEAQRQAEKEAAGPVPTGRVEMFGEVVGMKEVEDRFSYHSDSKTMLVIKLENGSKVYGSRFENLDKGDKVRFVATVEASKNDPKFGFYKRPVLAFTKTQKQALAKLSRAANSLQYETDRPAMFELERLMGEIRSESITSKEVR